ncbi:MAG: diaminopimelate decarboxylase [Solobacterium sp.]|nr:diaminopimelate decarboxylase [Solobacterium sp.]
MTKIAHTEAKQLAQQYGTPLFVYDEKMLCAKMDDFTKYFQSDAIETGVIYASKAFCCKAMVQLAAQHGLYLDVVSGGELYTALKAGFDPERIFFHGNNKTPQELSMALKNHVGTIVVDNRREALRLKELLADSDTSVHVLLRINPGIEAHTHKYIVTAHVDSKFGIALVQEDEVIETIRILQETNGIIFDGLHVHIGSQIFAQDAFTDTVKKVFGFAKHLQDAYQIDVHTVDLGGGFAARYTDEDAPIPVKDVCQAILNACTEANASLSAPVRRVMIEPGRSIVGEAGYTLYTVGSLKKTPNRHYIFVDGGMSDNIRPALYQAKYDAVLDGKEDAPAADTYTIAGKCCESGDIIIDAIALPEAEENDLLIVKTTGAYGYSMASHYNRMLMPAVVFAKDGDSRLVIRRETYDDLIALEV